MHPPATDPRRSTLRRGLQVVWIGIKGEPRWFAVAVAGSLIYGVLTVGTSWVIGRVFREIVTPAVAAGAVTSGQLAQAGGWLAAVVLINIVGVLARRLAAARVSYNLGAVYRQAVTRQYVTLPLSWHHRHPSGQLLSNANADVEAAWGVFAPLPMALGVAVMLVVAGIQLIVLDPWVALVGMAVFPALFAVNAVFQTYMSPLITSAQQLRAEVSEVAHESFEAALVVKTLGREDAEADRFGAVSDRLRGANVAVGRTRGVFDPVIEALPVLGTLIVLAVGVRRVATGDLSAAEVVQIAYLFSILSFPVRAFGWVLGELPRSVVGWDRVAAVLAAGGSMRYGRARLDRVGPLAVDVEAVRAGYDIEDESGAPSHHQVLQDVSFRLPAGRTVALVGATGSGKSTLADLVVRLVDPQSGTVSYDGVDVRELAREELPRAAALAAQTVFLFDDTVRGNITLGAPATDDEVWEALDAAEASGFVRGLTDGLDTRVGERGTSLSGGQRQRLALARALIRRPRLLILDDATSAVDPAVEQAILARLRSVTGGMTVLVVAHRLATIALADEVLHLQDGRIADHGTHAELVERSASYRELVRAYADDSADRAGLDGPGGGEWAAHAEVPA